MSQSFIKDIYETYMNIMTSRLYSLRRPIA